LANSDKRWFFKVFTLRPIQAKMGIFYNFFAFACTGMLKPSLSHWWRSLHSKIKEVNFNSMWQFPFCRSLGLSLSRPRTLAAAAWSRCTTRRSVSLFRHESRSRPAPSLRPTDPILVSCKIWIKSHFKDFHSNFRFLCVLPSSLF